MGALIGALYIVFILIFRDISFYSSILAKFLLSVIIVTITFKPKNIKELLKNIITFYFSTFVFAGTVFAIIYLNNENGFIGDGIMYVDVNSTFSTILISLALCGIIVKLFIDLMQSRIIKSNYYVEIKIVFNNKEVDLNALLDSGNFLKDPLTNTPVIVTELNAVKKILPTQILSFIEKFKNENDNNEVLMGFQDSEWITKLRLIPFSSIGNRNGLLLAFKPDLIKVNNSKKTKVIEECLIGIYKNKLSNNGEYAAILSPELI